MRPLIGVTTDREGDLSLLKDAYGTAVRRHGGLPVALLSPGEPPQDGRRAEGSGEISELIERIDGLLLTGGADLMPELYGEETTVPAEVLRFADARRSAFESVLVREAVGRRKPLLAICYGMQVLNVALGGSLFQDILCQVTGALDHRKGTHEIRILRLPGGRFESRGLLVDPRCRVNSSHHQAVKSLGERLEVFAVAEDGVAEGLFMKDYPFLVGVQWHPERSLPEPLSADLFSSFVRAAAADRRSAKAVCGKQKRQEQG